MKIEFLSFFKIIMLSTVFLYTSCRKSEPDAAMAGPDEYYTCSMDPQVVENKPGNCPICHMKLIKVKKNNLKEGQIKLSKQQIQLANITYDTVQVREMFREILTTGKFSIDQNNIEVISAKVSGRITNLRIKNAGEFIHKNQLIYTIYSEDLNTAQQDYKSALERGNQFKEFADAAKNRLILNGMSAIQINQIATTGVILQEIPVYSNTDGYVENLSIQEGNYVNTGEFLFQLASLNSMWVEAQVYLPSLNVIHVGTKARIQVPYSANRTFDSEVFQLEPQLSNNNRFVIAKLKVSNPSSEFRPGMLVNVAFDSESIKTLAIPSEAVIENSQGSNVWVRNSDGVFENRMIKTGFRNNALIEILDGINAGDMVVINGAYLLNSEYVFKRGSTPMSGHDHGPKSESEKESMPGMKM